MSDEPVMDGRALLESFDLHRPGYGGDDYLAQPDDHAMAYAVYACAAYLMGDIERADRACDWLIKNSRPGWGLPFAWKSFGIEPENPVTTVYGITVAWGVRALLDANERTGSSLPLETAIAALDSYSQFFCTAGDGGYFSYSDQSKDDIDVHNVSSMLLCQYARAGALTGRRDLKQMADAAAEHLWLARRSSPQGDFWSYDPDRGRWNDSIHGAYIVQGLLDYRATGGRAVPHPRNAIRMLRTYVREGQVFEFATHDGITQKQAERPARQWGSGMLTYTFSCCGETRLAEQVARTIDSVHSDPRIRSHVLLGIAKSEQAKAPWWRAIPRVRLLARS